MRAIIPKFRTEGVGRFFLEGVDVVKAADEEQVGELLDHRDGVGDAAGPEGFPDFIDLVAEFACEHGYPLQHVMTDRAPFPAPALNQQQIAAISGLHIQAHRPCL